MREGSAVAETVERLGRAIGMGLLRPGDRLPPESRLAEDLGISPVTLRSAIAILRGAGALRTARGRGGGTVVIDAPRPLPPAGELPTAAELRDLADYRVVVEGGAAQLAAERADDAQVAHLERLLADLEATDDYATWGERDTLLHLLIADASGSPRLVAQVAEVRAEVYRIGRLGAVPPAVVALADTDHRQLVQAIAARDGAAARDAMERHVASTGRLWLGLGRAGDA